MTIISICIHSYVYIHAEPRWLESLDGAARLSPIYTDAPHPVICTTRAIRLRLVTGKTTYKRRDIRLTTIKTTCTRRGMLLRDSDKYLSLSLSLYIYTYMYTHMCVCMYVCMYIYIYTINKYA